MTRRVIVRQSAGGPAMIAGLAGAIAGFLAGHALGISQQPAQSGDRRRFHGAADEYAGRHGTRHPGVNGNPVRLDNPGHYRSRITSQTEPKGEIKC